MKFRARQSIVHVMAGSSLAGMCVLLSGAQSKSAGATAPDTKPTIIYRFYGGADGLSHVERINVDFNIHRGADHVAELMAVNGAELREDKPDSPAKILSSTPFHSAVCREYIFNLQGHVQVEFSDGEKLALKPGDIELEEDVPPAKGHRTLNVGPEDRIALFIPISDQPAAVACPQN